MWKTEKEFGKSVMSKLKREGMRCIRIETAGTITGMPDMYVDGHGIDMFIELKNDPRQHIANTSFKVPWRPGQQAWSLDYFINHAKHKCTLTLLGCSDGIVIVPMIKHYENNIVENSDATKCSELLSCNLAKVLFGNAVR